MNDLVGAIPPELGNLVNLTRLSLLANQLTGTIPSELGNLVSLQYLYLSYNDLTGAIPVSLGIGIMILALEIVPVVMLGGWLYDRFDLVRDSGTFN